jgi:hypothetical protein
MDDDDRPDWFAPKRYGYGAASPISWQGWALLGGYIVLISAAGFLIPRITWMGFVSVVLILTVTFSVIAARTRTTKGGWKWRWGDPD